MSTAASETQTGALVERFGLKALVESCLVLEEGVASVKDIEIGMMMGAGILPGRSPGPTSAASTTSSRRSSARRRSGARPSSRR